MLKFVRCTAYLTLPLALGGSAAALAQQPGPLPLPSGPVPAFSATVAPVAQGTVARFIINPPGEVDGLLLSDGTQVRFPPHMSGELVAAVRVGDPVAIQGFREYQGAVKAFVVTNTRTNQSVVEHEPTTPPLPPHLRNVGLSGLSVAGRIQYLMYGPRGELNGVMLDNGGIVRFPPDVGYQFANQLQVGQPITALGYGTQNQYGLALEATAIGATGQAPLPIYGAGPVGPNAVAPARR
jgi:hypothetical protein